MHRLRLSVFLSAAALVGGPGFAQTTPRPVAAKDLAKYWLVASEAMEAMRPNTGVNLYAPSCAVVRYVINSDGTTSDVVLEKLMPPGDLGVVATTAIQSLRYAPAPSNQALVPVLTRVTLPINLPPLRGTPEEQARLQAQRDQVLARCEPATAAPARAGVASDKPVKGGVDKDKQAPDESVPDQSTPVRQR
ncbi:energy transducer TonB [Tahibacter caeni]|uniref:energy transducer TonB n=1 Tax=Tahibacter caeni TaxID=1453545 RepID=UPI0021485E8C|nr:energy transducer TonB [Tahibacter caeni]